MDKRNARKCIDLTPYEAFNNIEKAEKKEVHETRESMNERIINEIWFIAYSRNQAIWHKRELERASRIPLWCCTRLFPFRQLDGLNSRNAMLVLCAGWYENKLYDNDVFRQLKENAARVITFDELVSQIMIRGNGGYIDDRQRNKQTTKQNK